MDIPKFILLFIAPRFASSLGITLLDKNVTNFFVNIVRKTMKTRKETGLKRNDMIDIFIEEMEKVKEDSFFSKEELELGFVATAILFFFAGFDTTSSTLSVVVHALLHHQDVQEKVREEINSVILDDDFTAEDLKELKYTENVINESLRKYFSLGKN